MVIEIAPKKAVNQSSQATALPKSSKRSVSRRHRRFHHLPTVEFAAFRDGFWFKVAVEVAVGGFGPTLTW
jgi:hypothetical protein